MDAQLKVKWVEALRSGEFKQGQGKLHNPEEDSYCCLGVLCKITGAEWSNFSALVEEEDYDGDSILVPRNYSHVPLKDGQCLASGDDEELSASACHTFGIKHQEDLIELNDGRDKPSSPTHVPPKSFPEIADFIEKNL